MLEGLHVKNLVIIDEAEVSFSEGLNILTGETGAGKSVVIGSINLALGAKAGKNLVRAGKDSGFVELVFSVNEDTKNKLKCLDVVPEEGLVVITRKFTNERSMCKINGETVTISKIREVASILLDIHGQTENQTLLLPKNHLEILDRYCKEEVHPLKARLSSLVAEYREKENELTEYNADEAYIIRELDFLKYECSEIKKAKLIKGEEEELDKKVRKYSASSKIVNLVEEARTSLSDNGGADDSIGSIVRAMSRLSDVDDGAVELLNQISDIESLLNDFERSLSDYAEENLFDENDFMQSESRLDKIRAIFAKHGGSYETTLEFLETSLKQIEKFENSSEYKEKLSLEVEKLRGAILSECDKLTEARKKGAKELVGKVKQALVDLNFLQVEFELEFAKAKEFTAKGNDDVIFKISTNPGEELRSISEIASGGELSRIMLAIKSVMADTDEVPTLIFDEVDTGISGRTAQMVAEKMALISGKRQIIAITHLAQIAAMADSHYLIEKKSDKSHTATNIKKLDCKDEIMEIARILGGVAITENVINSAKEMKSLASEIKSKF
ncbi:MAG: DNA repair protein RecN [Catonella sp.]|uniref:DNA repair protein RecN n=1 Tax=Catonella sp. TaxID=2382125 RepID=UPI003FA098F8